MPEPKETIGRRLKRIRAERRIPLEKASEATRVRLHYLQALEEDNYSAMSSAAQGRGFLKLYAAYLDLDLDAAMDELRNADSADAPPETLAPEPASPTPEPVPAQPAPPASSSDGTVAHRPFWARLLRRSASEADATPESAPSVTEESIPTSAALPEAESESKAAPAKKTAAKKPNSTAVKDSKSKSKAVSEKAKKTDAKKKGSLKKAPTKK